MRSKRGQAPAGAVVPHDLCGEVGGSSFNSAQNFLEDVQERAEFLICTLSAWRASIFVKGEVLIANVLSHISIHCNSQPREVLLNIARKQTATEIELRHIFNRCAWNIVQS